MSNLVKLREDLSTVGGNFMGPLRDSEFLSAIKHRSAIPGGTCDFDLPDYSYWLNRPAEVRAAEFGSWLALIRPLCDSIAELLWLTRQNAKRKSEIAVGGIFQLQFDRENPCQLVRVTLPPDSVLFPEISGNQHRCTIRFLKWTDATSRPVHVEMDVPFLADLLLLIRAAAVDGRHGEMPDLSATGGVVGGIDLSPVLQRSLPAHRLGRVAHRTAQDSGRIRTRRRRSARRRPGGSVTLAA